MTFILLSTNAQDENDRVNESIVCSFAMPNHGKHEEEEKNKISERKEKKRDKTSIVTF